MRKIKGITGSEHRGNPGIVPGDSERAENFVKILDLWRGDQFNPLLKLTIF
jgi:hypothetical protein